MAQFQEENLFQGAAQAQGFSPLQAPDLSPFLRENAQQQNRNLANLKSQQQAINEAQLKRKLQLYEGLKDFSPVFMKAAQQLGQAYINNQMVEGNAVSRDWGLENNFGEPIEKTQQQKAATEILKQEDGKAAAVANEAANNGEPMDYINAIKQLPQYQRIVATQNYLTNRGQTASDSLSKYLLQKNTHRAPDGSLFTTDQANLDPVKTRIVVQDWAKGYDTETGVENFSTFALSKYNEAIRNLQQGTVNHARDQNNLRTSHQIRATYVEGFKNGTIGINELFNGVTGTFKTKDQRYGFKETWDFIFTEVLPAGYRNGWADDTKVFGPKGDGEGGLLGEKSTVDPSKTLLQMYPVRVSELKETIRKIKTNKRSELNGARQDMHRQILELGYAYFRNEDGKGWDGDYVKGEQFIADLQLRAPEANLSPLKVFTARAQQNVNADFWREELEERKQNFTLSSSTLNDDSIPAALREQYRQDAADQDAVRAGFELSDSQLRTELSTDLRESLGQTSLDKTASGLQTATSYAVNQVRANLYRQFLRDPNNVSQAEAVAAVRKDIIEKKGQFAVSSFELQKDKTSNYFTQFTPKTTQTPQGQMAAAINIPLPAKLAAYNRDPTIITQAPMVDVAVLEQMAADIRAGKQPEVPAIYRTLYASNKAGYNTLADFVNANLSIPVLGISERLTPTHTDRLKERTSDPGIQSFLDRADTIAGLQQGQALATPGATRDPRFMNPAVAQRYNSNANPMPNPGGSLSPDYESNRHLNESIEARALLRTIRYAEGTDHAMGYNTMFTGRKFTDTSRHPRQLNYAIIKGKRTGSDAAGAYQYLSTTWQPYADKLGITDFSPTSQDRVALSHVRALGVNPSKLLTRESIDKLSGTWASFPTLKTGTSRYGQGGKTFEQLLRYYNNALEYYRKKLDVGLSGGEKSLQDVLPNLGTVAK